jgi:chromosome segregation ATPase
MLVACLQGCATLSTESRAAEEMLLKADALAARGDDRGASAAYAEVAARYPDLPAGSRARILRDALDTVQRLRAEVQSRATELVAARRELAERRRELAVREADLARLHGDLARLHGDLARVHGELGVRDQEVSRLRVEVAARQSDVTRLSAESERLRADIDQLKRIDLRIEQEGARWR